MLPFLIPCKKLQFLTWFDKLNRHALEEEYFYVIFLTDESAARLFGRSRRHTFLFCQRLLAGSFSQTSL